MPEVITLNELTNWLRCNRSTIYRLIKKANLPYFKVGKDYRFNTKQIEQWIEHKHQVR